MRIAGFDPSLTHFGWVLLDIHKSGRDSLCDYGTFRTKPEDGLLIHRLIYLREILRKFLIDNQISFVSMEAPYWFDYNTELLFALNQFIHDVYLDLGIFALCIPPTRLKKYAIPDMVPNDVTKHHITHQAKDELDMHGKRFSEHVSDAYFAGKIGVRFYRWHVLKEVKDEDLGEYEKELFCGTHTYKRGVKKGITEYNGIIYKPNDQYFDYSNQKKKTRDIIKEIENG